MNNDKSNYVVLTKKVTQLKPILLAATALKEEQTTAFGEFHIIICGKGISEITDAEIVQPHLEKAKKTGAKIFACGFSLDKFKIDRTKIATEINIVDNGILYNFQLQNKGYSSLSL